MMLGTQSNVRVLRELSRHGGLLSAPSLAHRSGLAASSVRSALAGLEASGIVWKVGSGRIHLYQFRAEHPLAAALGNLFEAEDLVRPFVRAPGEPLDPAQTGDGAVQEDRLILAVGAKSKILAANARARARFAEEIPCFTSADLSGPAGQWKAERKAFSVQLGGRELFPAFQFRGGKPDPAVARVLEALPPGMSQWQVAFWFVSSNPWLDGGVPSENLGKADLLVKAAHRLGEEAAG